MKADDLKYLVSTLPDSRSDDLSDTALSSLSYSYISIHNLVVINGLDREFGDRAIHLKRINDLQETCRKRCGRQMPLARRSRILRLWFSLIREPALVFTDGQKEAACREAALEAIREYGEEIRNSRDNSPGIQSKDAFELLRCMADLLYPFDEYEEEEEKIRRYLTRKIAAWAEQMHPDGAWPGLSDDEALERIEIMNRYAGMFLDPAYNIPIGQAYAHYCNLSSSDRLLANGRSWENLQTLGRFYDVTMQNMLYPRDRILAAKIADALDAYGRSLPEKSDERLYCARYVIDSLCERIMDEIQQPEKPQPDGMKPAKTVL